jgi:hypothetical protein
MRGERRTGARAPLAVGAASLEINPSGRAGEGSDAAIAEREPVMGGVWIRDNAGRRHRGSVVLSSLSCWLLACWGCGDNIAFLGPI